MLDGWRDLDPSQRRLLGVLGSLVVAVGLVVGVVTLTGSDSKVALRTDQSSSSTSSAEVTVTSLPGDVSTSTSTSTSGSRSGSSTTIHGATPTTRPSGSGGTGTTATTKGGSTGTTTGTTPTTTGTTGTTATTSDAACNPGGGGSDANQIANLFCQYRSDHGLAKMTRNSGLDQEAQAWAQKMANDAASGTAPDTALQHNLDPNTGYKAAVKADCSRCTGWAENVAYDTTASGAWSEWLQSSGHLANISDGHAGEYGVGVASGGGFLWFVQDFGRYP